MRRAVRAPASSGRAGAGPTTPRRSSVSAIMRSWMALEGTVGRVRWRESPSWPSHPPPLRKPPPHRGLTFATRTAFSPRWRRGDPSSLEDNAVPDRKVRPRWRRRRRQHDGRRASGEELRLRTAPGRRVGAKAHDRCRLSLAPTRELRPSRSLSSSSPRSPRCPPRHPGSRRRRHHRRRPRSVPWPRSPRRSPRRRPPPRPAHRPPP